MKRTNQNAASVPVPKFDLSIDAKTLSELRELLDQRTKLDDAMSSGPADIVAAEVELAGLRQQFAALEADVVLVDDAKLPSLQKEIAKLADMIDEKDLSIRRMKVRLDALEARAPELDNKIDLAIGYVRVEANMAAQNLQVELAETLRSRVAEVRMIYAQVRALDRLVPMNRTRDFLISAHMPDLESCMVINSGAERYDMAPNLLAITDADTVSAEAEIVKAMKSISDALKLAHSHRPYVPLAKRPQPYVFRGSNQGPARGLGGSIGPGEPPVPVEQPESKFKGYRTDEPYEIKSDMSGRRTREAAATEMNMGRAIIQAAESADR
ncbi:hypothetical protein [Burkholderia vietnamiensis]|uniref:hypothetical protein n=1 Tax=Burkholderia vietnamiensis TaxID=60552 RepID=UPI0007534504|nr:hypothetical protein [Burkholderia vietnamiensis]KVF38047.1 hypothetical protein WJ09_03130 [Burkholderia vietnamiensis]